MTDDGPPGSWLRLPERARGEELMDRPDVEQAMLIRSLEQVGRVNRALGGIRSLMDPIASLAGPGGRISLLDVGVGDGRLPRTLADRLERRGVWLEWAGVDLHPRALAAARSAASAEGPPRLVNGDGRALPFRNRSFDVVATTLTLHHLEDPECVAFLGEMGRVARRAVLVSDLERHPVHYLGARVLAATVWRRDPITRHDGPLSVLRGFTSEELLRLARQAGLQAPMVRRYLPFRLLLSARPAGSRGSPGR